ncbi:MAG: sensor histidine kinase [Thiomicrorhabdus sp.]|nr:sensor histidine kinase [Thiomicrorhabdus sp.]
MVFSTNANAVILSGEHSSHFFSVDSFVDPSSTLTLADVLKEDGWQTQANHFSFGYSSDTHWLRVELTNISDKPLSPVIWLTETFLHKVVFYEKVDQQWKSHFGGLHVDTNQKNALDTYPHFSVQLQPQEEKVIYVQLDGQLGIFAALLVTPKTEFYGHVLKKSMFFSATIMALLMLSLFYLVLHLYLKERSFIYYSLYSMSYSVWVALYNGLIPMFFNEWLNNALYIFMPVAFIFLIKFSQSILDSRSNNPLCHALLNVSVVLFILVMAFIPFDLQTGFILHNVVVTLTMLLLIFLSLKSLARQERMINLYVVGLFAYFSGMIVLSMLSLGWLPYNILTRNAPFPGSVIEFAFFAYILVLKVFQIQDDKELANQYLVEMQSKNNLRLERQVSERTAELESMLKKQNRLVTEYSNFISFITHELRNPLGIIKSQVALLRKESDKGIDKSKQRINTISTTTQRMEMLFDDWLISDKLENDLFSIEIQPFELSEWLGSLEEMIKQTYSSHQFHFEKQQVTIYADSVLLKLALYNLIDNAVKYSPVGSEIVVKVDVTEDDILIQVQDQGTGVPEEDAQNIFERFVRRKCDNHIKGTGLGLSLVKNVMALHGGSAYLDKNYQGGSCFVLHFKRA